MQVITQNTPIKPVKQKNQMSRWGAQAALMATMAAGTLGVRPVHAQELLVNGGFETGTLTGWTLADAPGSITPGSFVIGNNTPDTNLTPPAPSTPLEHFASAGAGGGDFYAVSDSAGAGAHALLQNFTLAPNPQKVIFSFDMFVNDWNGAGALNADDVFNPNQMDAMGALIPTQFASVDLLAGNAAALTSNAGLLDNLYLGETGFTAAGLPNGYQHFAFDITNFVRAGGTYRIRFGETDNQFTLSQGVDNVSVFATPAPVPEPGIVTLFIGLTGTGAGFLMRRRARTPEYRKDTP